MLKLSAILGSLGMAMLLFSLLPWPGAMSSAAGVAPAPAAAVPGHGAALFRDKGCAMCHRHDGLEGKTGVFGPFGPDLTNYRNDPAFLRRWLADPLALRTIICVINFY